MASSTESVGEHAEAYPPNSPVTTTPRSPTPGPTRDGIPPRPISAQHVAFLSAPHRPPFTPRRPPPSHHCHPSRLPCNVPRQPISPTCRHTNASHLDPAATWSPRRPTGPTGAARTAQLGQVSGREGRTWPRRCGAVRQDRKRRWDGIRRWWPGRLAGDVIRVHD